MYKQATWRAVVDRYCSGTPACAAARAQGQDTTGNTSTGQDEAKRKRMAGDAAPDGLDDVVESEGVADQGEPQAATEDGVLAPKAAVQLFLPALQGGNAPPGQVDAFFTHAWAAEPCSNVVNSGTNRGFGMTCPVPAVLTTRLVCCGSSPTTG
ncbi:MAG: hypothetical protein IPK16_13505 [Anaerolineales bacterium]|nr:hypothetical protein [Anaerolineales bacterium]